MVLCDLLIEPFLRCSHQESSLPSPPLLSPSSDSTFAAHRLPHVLTRLWWAFVASELFVWVPGSSELFVWVPSSSELFVWVPGSFELFVWVLSSSRVVCVSSWFFPSCFCELLVLSELFVWAPGSSRVVCVSGWFENEVFLFQKWLNSAVIYYFCVDLFRAPKILKIFMWLLYDVYYLGKIWNIVFHYFLIW